MVNVGSVQAVQELLAGQHGSLRLSVKRRGTMLAGADIAGLRCVFV